MRVDDRLLGLILVLLGASIFMVARTFPLMAGMPYGPGFFPSIAAAGLVVCGIVVAVSGQLRLRAAAAGDVKVTSRPRINEGGPGVWFRPLAIALVVTFFGLTLPWLGFHISAVITVAAAAFVFGASPLVGLVLAVAAAFGAHAAFYSMLRVPLPWGVLTPYAW
ncbi:MAG: tripartite tricarboxylate transporter TctB family protein [Pseudomonadota bacterium]